MAKQAKFFCDFCKSEVKPKDKFCKNCGKFFSSVKCPQCGKIGSQNEFAEGCPICGYAGTDSVQEKPPQNNDISSQSKKNHRHDDPLPIWIYLFCGCILAGVLYFLLNYIR